MKGNGIGEIVELCANEGVIRPRDVTVFAGARAVLITRVLVEVMRPSLVAPVDLTDLFAVGDVVFFRADLEKDRRRYARATWFTGDVTVCTPSVVRKPCSFRGTVSRDCTCIMIPALGKATFAPNAFLLPPLAEIGARSCDVLRVCGFDVLCKIVADPTGYTAVSVRVADQKYYNVDRGNKHRQVDSSADFAHTAEAFTQTEDNVPWLTVAEQLRGAAAWLVEIMDYDTLRAFQAVCPDVLNYSLAHRALDHASDD